MTINLDCLISCTLIGNYLLTETEKKPWLQTLHCKMYTKPGREDMSNIKKQYPTDHKSSHYGTDLTWRGDDVIVKISV